MAHRAVSRFHLLQGKPKEAFNAVPLGGQLTVAVDADLRHGSSWLGRPRVEGEEGGGCTHIHTIHTLCNMEACYIRECFFFAPYRCWLRARVWSLLSELYASCWIAFEVAEMVPGARRLWIAVSLAFVVGTKVRGVRKG